MNLVIAGATGLVGRNMLKLIEERGFPFSQLTLAASSRSAGTKISIGNKEFEIVGMNEALASEPGIALFSAGSAASKEWAPRFSEAGFTVIDNSSAWRRNTEIPLIVPEVNGRILTSSDKIIANPNCSTIQMVMALYPIHKELGVKRVVVSTYQSVTGSGVKGIAQLRGEEAGKSTEMAYPHPIYNNLIPHGGDFLEGGYTAEEEKLIFETRKILGDQSIEVSPTVVRVPVTGGHSESLNVELIKDAGIEDLRHLLIDMPGVQLIDDPGKAEYPMPLYAEGRDEVFVGRLRIDPSQKNTFNLWVVSDNLRKGAATNAVQIAEYLLENNLV